MAVQPPDSSRFDNVNDILKSANKQLEILEDKAKDKPSEITQDNLKAYADSINGSVEQWADLERQIVEEDYEEPDVKIINDLFQRIQRIEKSPTIQARVGSVAAADFIAALQQLKSKVLMTFYNKERKSIPPPGEVPPDGGHR